MEIIKLYCNYCKEENIFSFKQILELSKPNRAVCSLCGFALFYLDNVNQDDMVYISEPYSNPEELV